MTQQEQNQLWDELIDMREELTRMQHMAQEALDAMSLMANLFSPHVNRLRLQMRRKDDRIIYMGILIAFKQAQQRVAAIAERVDYE